MYRTEYSLCAIDGNWVNNMRIQHDTFNIQPCFGSYIYFRKLFDKFATISFLVFPPSNFVQFLNITNNENLLTNWIFKFIHFNFESSS